MVHFNKFTPCQMCSGKSVSFKKCHKCHGKGFIRFRNAICCMCKGEGSLLKHCGACKGKGVVSKSVHKRIQTH